MTKAVLIIDDSQYTVYKNNTVQTYEKLEEITLSDVTAFELYINASELDVSFTPLPTLSFLDRHNYLKQKRKNKKSNLMTSNFLVKGGQIEITCPKTNKIQELLEQLIKARKKINFIKPLLLPAIGTKKDKCTLVVSAYNSVYLRQTAYLDSNPIFTRLTEKQDLAQEILATLAYLKNQHQFLDCIIQCHLNVEDCQLIQNALRNIAQLDLHPISTNSFSLNYNTQYRFDLPESIVKSNLNLQLNRFNKIAIALIMLSLSFGIWQFKNFIEKKNNHKLAVLKTVELDQQIRLTKTKLPIDKILPPTYLASLSDSSPVLLFHKIAIAMPADLTLSALKWENSKDEERLLLELRLINQDEEADQNIDVVQDFQIALQGALPEFVMQTQSLPHASGQNETFTGTVTQENLTLSGDQSKAMVEFKRKKKS